MMKPVAVRRVCIAVDEVDPTRPASAQTVVLATTDPNLRAAATRSLRDAGYAVIEAAHSGHALLACLTSGPVALLVTELAMDETSGPALAQRIRRHHPDLRAIYLAQSGTPETSGVLVRPFTREDLLREVDLVLTAVTSQG